MARGNGVMTCTSPGTATSECGANMAEGTQLKFSIMYVTGNPLDRRHDQHRSWRTGLRSASTSRRAPNTLNNLATECTGASATPWSICWTGESWNYDPNYYPSGEQMFVTGASTNSGGYDDPQMNASSRPTHAEGAR